MINQIDILENSGLINYNNNFNKDNECYDFFQLDKSTNINKISYIKQPVIPNAFINSFEENSLESKINKYSLNLNTIAFEDIIFKDDFKIGKEENILHKKIFINKKKFMVRKYYNEKDKKIFSIAKKMKLGRNKKNSQKKGKHNKFRQDNIIKRFKVHLMKSIYDYIIIYH